MRTGLPVLLCLLAACGTPADPGSPDPGSGTPPPAATPNPSVATVGGCQVFPGDNAWNRDVSADPVDPASNALLTQMLPDSALHLDLGTTEEYYGIPFVVVPQSQPLVSIAYGTDGADYSDESDPGPMPIPLNAPIEGGSTADPNPSSGDRHVLVVQQGDCILYELYNTVRTGTGFMVSSSARWDLKINASRPAGWTSADAAGLPILPGLLKYEEVAANHLTHALRFTVPRARRAYMAPASHCGQHADPSLPAYGLRGTASCRLRPVAVYRRRARNPERAQEIRPHLRGSGQRLVCDWNVRQAVGDCAGSVAQPQGVRSRLRGGADGVDHQLLSR